MAPPGSAEPSRKRRKVAESCKLCRTKKTRCDGLRPACSTCTEKCIACEYNDATIPVAAGSLEDIQERLRKLEQRTVSTSECTPVSTATNRTSTEILDSDRERPFVEHQTTYFIQQITQPTGALPTTTPSAENDNTWTVETDFASMVVPPRGITDDLVHCFETYVYPLFPILHMPSFHERYRRVWEPQMPSRTQSPSEEVSFHAVLNSVFALGCISNSNVDSQVKLRVANTFYQRTRKLLPLDALDMPSIETVQCLLLTAIYLTHTKYSYRCSNVLAVALRNTQALGQLMDIEVVPNTLLRREMYRRVWHHCMLLERQISNLFGRVPTLASQSAVPLPRTIDDEQLVTDDLGPQSDTTPSILDAFIVSLKIFEVLDGARNIDGKSIHHSFGLLDLAETLRLNEQLDTIENMLPAHLKRSDSDEGSMRDRVFKLQAEAVLLRMFKVRLVLLRPHVLAAARRSFSSPDCTQSISISATEATLQRAVSSLALQTAVSATTMLHRNLHSPYRIMSSSVVYMVLSAATVIVAGSLVPELEVNVETPSTYSHAIIQAFEVIEGHQLQIEGARGARRQLENFLETARKAVVRRNASTPDSPNNGGILQETGQLSSTMGSGFGIGFNDPLWNMQWVDSSLWPFTPGS